MRKRKRIAAIICLIVILAMLLAMIVPMFVHTAHADNGIVSVIKPVPDNADEDNTESEDNPHIGNTSDEFKKNSNYAKVTGERANWGERTIYDDYTDFDELFEKERESKYKHSVLTNYKFTISESAEEITLSIKHNGEEAAGELELFNENGNRVPAEFEYLPGEIVVRLRNVTGGSHYAVQGELPSGIIGVEQLTTSEYIEGVKKTFQEEFNQFGYVSIDDEINRSLSVKDKITESELARLLETYPLIPSDSLLKREGVASAFIKVQNDYNVSALGLLAIACLESNYGTSRIAREKQNLFGWGAVDSNPYNGAWDWSDMPTSEAIYKALSLIADRYTNGRYSQNTYYKMRYNTVNGQPTHQYCTSKTWIYSNAKIRAQLEVYIGLR